MFAIQAKPRIKRQEVEPAAIFTVAVEKAPFRGEIGDAPDQNGNSVAPSPDRWAYRNVRDVPAYLRYLTQSRKPFVGASLTSETTQNTFPHPFRIP